MPSTTKTEKKQQNILDVAADLFLERGYDAVSLDDIVDRVGGSKTTLYSYYGGKEGLFAAIVEKTSQAKLAPLLKLDVTHLDPEAGLNAIGRTFLSVISDADGRCLYRMMIAEAERFPDLAAAFYRSGPEVTIGLLRRHLAGWQKRGLLRSGHSETLAVQFIGILLGNFHLKHLLGLSTRLTQKQIGAWVTRGVDLFLEGAREDS